MSIKQCPFKFSSFLAPAQPKSGIVNPHDQLQFVQANVTCPCIIGNCMAWSIKGERCMLIPEDDVKAG